MCKDVKDELDPQVILKKLNDLEQPSHHNLDLRFDELEQALRTADRERKFYCFHEKTS